MRPRGEVTGAQARYLTAFTAWLAVRLGGAPEERAAQERERRLRIMLPRVVRDALRARVEKAYGETGPDVPARRRAARARAARRRRGE